MSKTKQTALESPKLGLLPALASSTAGQVLVVNASKDGYDHADLDDGPFPLEGNEIVNVGLAVGDDFTSIQDAFNWVVSNFYPAGGTVLISINDVTGLTGGLSITGGDWPWVRITTDGLLAGDPGAIAFDFYGCGTPVLDFVEVDTRPGVFKALRAELSTVRMRQDCRFNADGDSVEMNESHWEIGDPGTGSAIDVFCDNPVNAALYLRNTTVQYRGDAGTLTVVGGYRQSGAGQGVLADFGALNLLLDRYITSSSFGSRSLYIQGGAVRCSSLTVRNLDAGSTDIPMALVYPASLDCLNLTVDWPSSAVTVGTQNAMTLGQGTDIAIRGSFSAEDSTGPITLGDPVDLSTPGTAHGGTWKVPSTFNLPAGVSPNSFNGGDVLVVGGV